MSHCFAIHSIDRACFYPERISAIFKLLQSLAGYFFSDYRFRTQTRWFKRLLYIYLLLQCTHLLFYYDLFFGENSIVFITPQSIGFLRGLPYLLYNSTHAGLSRYFIFAALVICLSNLFSRRFFFFFDVLLWFLVINLNNRIYPALTGGDSLMNQFLFFNCFLSAAFAILPTWQGQLRICVHNLAVTAIIIQVCLVYFLSALAKLSDPGWLSGTAIINVSQVRHFSLYSFLSYSRGLDWLYIFLNYLVLSYQLLFPVLVWIRKAKKIFLVLGILMHLYIAFVMGLVGFGFIMILAYVFFWPAKQPV